jgi:hypothetical protein
MKQMNRDMIKNYKDAELSDEIFRNKRKEINEKSERFVDEASLIEKRLVIELSAKSTDEEKFIKNIEAEIAEVGLEEKKNISKIYKYDNITTTKKIQLLGAETVHYHKCVEAAWKQVYSYMEKNGKTTIKIFNVDTSIEDVNTHINYHRKKQKQ